MSDSDEEDDEDDEDRLREELKDLINDEEEIEEGSDGDSDGSGNYNKYNLFLCTRIKFRLKMVNERPHPKKIGFENKDFLNFSSLQTNC